MTIRVQCFIMSLGREKLFKILHGTGLLLKRAFLNVVRIKQYSDN